MLRFVPIFCLLVGTAQAVEIDPSESSFTWTASKVTGSKHTGQLPAVSSDITVKDGQVVRGQITLDMQNFTVTDLKGRIAQKFLRHIKSADFFNAEKFPTSRLEVLSVDQGVAKGRLQIMNTIKPVTFPIKKDGNVYSGTLIFDRTAFDIRYGSGKFFKGLGDKVISDEVSVQFSFSLKSNTTPAQPN